MEEERFLILCREPSPATDRLHKILSNLGRTEVISDTPHSDGVPGNDAGMEGYTGLYRWHSHQPPITAWERAWKHRIETPSSGGTWFVEDDVAGPLRDFQEVVIDISQLDPYFAAVGSTSQSASPDWCHWGHAKGKFDTPWRSFNPFCRLNQNMVEEAEKLRARWEGFTFLEVFFASCSMELNQIPVDIRFRHPERLKRFEWLPEVGPEGEGICHPVKDDYAHAKICGLGGSG